MTETVAAISERALRRLGVAIVPVADRPMLTVMVPVATIAERALQELGVVVPAANRPAAVTTIPAATIATNALLALGVIAADETPAALDQALALGRVNALHDGLIDQGVVSWAIGAIPQAVAEDYAGLAALHLASAFGKHADPERQPVLEARIRRVALVLRAQPLAEACVAQVQDALVAQAVVWWSGAGVPQALVMEYVDLTVVRLAPVFGVKVELDQAALEARVKHVALILSAPDIATDAVQAVHNDLSMRGLARWSVFDIPAPVADAYTMLAANAMSPEFGKLANPRDEIAAERAIYRYVSLPSSGEHVRAEYF